MNGGLVGYVRSRIAEERETARNEQAQRDRLVEARRRSVWEQMVGAPLHDELCEDDTVGPGLTTGCGCMARRRLHSPAATLTRCDFLDRLVDLHEGMHACPQSAGGDAFRGSEHCATVLLVAALLNT